MTWMSAEQPLTKLYLSFYQNIRRVLEIIVCLLVMPFLMIFALLMAVAIHFDSSGPVFLTQKRIGKAGRYFDLFKFRTRHYGYNRASDQAFTEAFIKGNVTTLPEESFDDNFTALGRVLHQTGLDDLPQLINVFKGEMSFVGPRPIAPREKEAYQAWHKERVVVLPGLTGLAQVRGRSGLLVDEIVQYDIEYIEKRGFWLDIKILWWAIVSVLINRDKR